MWHQIAHRNNLAQNKAVIFGLRKLYTVREAIVLKSPLQGTDKCSKTEVTAVDITFLADGLMPQSSSRQTMDIKRISLKKAKLYQMDQ